MGRKSKIAVVYQATNRLSGDYYIGLTGQYFNTRKAAHRRAALIHGSQTHFHRAIRKNGWDQFEFAVLSTWDVYEDAKREEIRCIAALSPVYNMTAGGDGAPGYRHSEEEKRRASERQFGKPGFWKGKKIPQHVADNLTRIRNSRTDKAAVLALGPKSQQRKVVCLDDGEIFQSIKYAAAHYGANELMISSCCKGGRHKTVKGLVFRYYGDHLGGKDDADAVRLVKAHKLMTNVPSYKKRVRCLTDGIVFDSVKMAAEHYGIDHSRVTKSAQDKYKSPIWEKLKFAYLEGVAV